MQKAKYYGGGYMSIEKIGESRKFIEEASYIFSIRTTKVKPEDMIIKVYKNKYKKEKG